MRLILELCCGTTLFTVLLLSLGYITAPEQVEMMLKTIATMVMLAISFLIVAISLSIAAIYNIVVLVLYCLIVVFSFSIASIVFFVICMRLEDSSVAVDDPFFHQRPFWTWDRWG